jgi:hypothetical protein
MPRQQIYRADVAMLATLSHRNGAGAGVHLRRKSPHHVGGASGNGDSVSAKAPFW